MKLQIKNNIVNIVCEVLTDLVFNKINELLKINKNFIINVKVNN